MVVQCQMVSSENIHTSAVETEQAIFRNIYICIYIHSHKQEETVDLEESGKDLEGEEFNYHL